MTWPNCNFDAMLPLSSALALTLFFCGIASNYMALLNHPACSSSYSTDYPVATGPQRTRHCQPPIHTYLVSNLSHRPLHDATAHSQHTHTPHKPPRHRDTRLSPHVPRHANRNGTAHRTPRRTGSTPRRPLKSKKLPLRIREQGLGLGA